MKEILVLSKEVCRQIYETYDESFPFMCVSSEGCVKFEIPDGCVLAVVVKDWDDVVIVKEVK